MSGKKEKTIFKTAVAACRLAFVFASAYLPPEPRYINVAVVPDHEDWLYMTGEKITFKVSVIKNGLTPSRA